LGSARCLSSGGGPAGQWTQSEDVGECRGRPVGPAEFGDEVLAALDDSGLPRDRLVLEITEGVVLKDLETVIARLTALRRIGVRIAIDDFGTGYSSLAYLRRLPVDILEVDKSFVDRVTSDAQDEALTHGIIAMSHSLNLETVAEGVESPEQAQWLARALCTFGRATCGRARCRICGPTNCSGRRRMALRLRASSRS